MALTALTIWTLVLTACLGIGGIAVALSCPGERGITYVIMDIIIYVVVAGSGFYAIFKRSPRALRIMIWLEGFQAVYGTFWWFSVMFADAVITSELKSSMTPEQRREYDEDLGPAYLWLAVAAVLYFMVRKQVLHELVLTTQEQQEGAMDPNAYQTGDGDQSLDQQSELTDGQTGQAAETA